MRISTKEPITSAKAREIALSATLLMLLCYHLFDGPLEHRHFFVSAGTGVGLGLTFRFLTRPKSRDKAGVA